MSPGSGLKPASGMATPSRPRSMTNGATSTAGAGTGTATPPPQASLTHGPPFAPFQPAATRVPCGKAIAVSAASAKTRAVPPPRTPVQTRIRCMVLPDAAAGDQVPRASGAAEPPQARGVAGHDQPEGDEPEGHPERHRPRRRGGVHLRVRELRQAAALAAPRPSAGSGGWTGSSARSRPGPRGRPCRRGDGAAGSWVSVCSRVRRPPARSGVMVRRRPRPVGPSRPRRPPTGASPG